MNRLGWKIPVVWVSVFCATVAEGQSSYDLRSPNGRIEVRIRFAGGLRYDVLLNGRALLQECTLALNMEHRSLGPEAKVLHAERAVSTAFSSP
jgi:hypothetical protein